MAKWAMTKTNTKLPRVTGRHTGPWNDSGYVCSAWLEDHGAVWTKKSDCFGSKDTNGNRVQARNSQCCLHSTTGCTGCLWKSKCMNKTLQVLLIYYFFLKKKNSQLKNCSPSSESTEEALKDLYFSEEQVFPLVDISSRYPQHKEGGTGRSRLVCLGLEIYFQTRSLAG